MYGKLTGSFIIANSSESDDPTGCDRLDGRMVICLTFLFSLWGIFLRILAGCSPGEPVFLVNLTDGILSVE